jgi:apolipoprotein N-acyltransferase
MKKARLLVLAALSALLLSLGLPNELFLYGQPLLGYLALVPLYFALKEAPSYGFAALTAGLFGALAHAISSYWLYFFHGFAFWTLGTSIIAYAILYAVYGLYLAFFLKKTGPWRPLGFALFWTLLEFVKSYGFLGYPWGLLPYTQTSLLPLLQLADITGVYGLSFILAFANASIAELLFRFAPPELRLRTRLVRPGPLSRSAAWRYGLGSLILLAFLATYGFLRLAFPPRVTSSFTAALVQQNADPWSEDEAAGILKNISLARDAIREGGRVPDIILFSESSLSRPYADFRSWYVRNPREDPLIPFVQETGSYLFTGSPIILNWDTYEATNSVILISPEAVQVGDYAKVHPVPFAEAIPFWEYKPFREFIQNVVGLQSGWVMGTEYKLFHLPVKGKTVTFGAPICFEDAFPDVCRQFMKKGADLLINLTNDSWSKTDSSEIQHYAAARFRAIEFRKALLRSTNGGLSCVIDARGEAHDLLPLFKPASEIVEVPIYGDAPPTVYLLLGDWFVWLCALVFSSWFSILVISEGWKRRAAR